MQPRAGSLNSAAPTPRLSLLHRGRYLATLTVAALVLAWAWDAWRESTAPEYVSPRFAVVASPASINATPALPALTEVESHVLPVTPDKPMSHASTLVALTERDGRRVLVAHWFAGSRESGPDVEIMTSRFDAVRNTWSTPSVAVNRQVLAQQLGFGVRRLGNSVGWVDRTGKLHLFAVATGLGGWGASRVVHLLSEDDGYTFTPLRMLPLSPLFNTSNLVRAPVVPLADGGALLPLYFEMGIKYPLALRISASGLPREVTRMSADSDALQPDVIPLDGLRAVALLRDRGDSRTMKLLSTSDGGRSWVDEGATNLANPNSSVAGLRLPSGILLAVLNPSPKGRHDLAIAASTAGHEWRILRMIEAGAENEEYSYPALLMDDGRLHVTYTYRRQSIRHRIYTIGALE